MLSNLKKSGLFATPDNIETLQDWIERHRAEDKISLYTAAGMASNLAIAMMEKERNESKSFKCLEKLIPQVKKNIAGGMELPYAVDVALTNNDNQGTLFILVKHLLEEYISNDL